MQIRSNSHMMEILVTVFSLLRVILLSIAFILFGKQIFSEKPISNTEHLSYKNTFKTTIDDFKLIFLIVKKFSYIKVKQI